MTPKEKAKELVDKYLNASFNCKGCDMPFCDVPCTMLNVTEAKECALICIDEMIRIAPWGGDIDNEIEDGSKEYYIKVKQEIEKL